MILSKQQILEAEDIKTETVPVPEWGGDVIVRVMSGTERDAWEASMAGKTREELLANARAKLAAICIVDEQGGRMFTDSEIEALGSKSSVALKRIIAAAERLNALGDHDIEALKGN